MKHLWWSWLVFFVVGGLMGLVRYGNVLPAEYRDLLHDFGPWVFGIIYVALILTAFKDTVFHGLMALLIPLYPFYYLFIVSDAFYVRAIVGGLLVGIGQDSALFFQKHATTLIDDTERWIQSGG